MLFSTLFLSSLSAQTTVKNCKPADCQKVCKKAVMAKADLPSCTAAKAVTVAAEDQATAKTANCKKVCPPQCLPLCNKVAKEDGDDVNHWAVTVGLSATEEAQQKETKKASCSQPCKAKAKTVTNAKRVASN